MAADHTFIVRHVKLVNLILSSSGPHSQELLHRQGGAEGTTIEMKILTLNPQIKLMFTISRYKRRPTFAAANYCCFIALSMRFSAGTCSVRQRHVK